MSESFWLSEPAEPLVRTDGGPRPDVVVVGAGVTGCSCALTLAEGGLRVRVHEARRVASGASGRNGGFALRGGAMSYAKARERFGPETAKAFWLLDGALPRPDGGARRRRPPASRAACGSPTTRS